MSARDVVDAYVERANALDVDGLMELFADDAVIAHVVGTFRGLGEIRRFYAEIVLPTKPLIGMTDFEETAGGCRVVFDATTDAFPGHTLSVTDLLTLDGDDRITRLEISTDLPA